jgi:restriction system protein
LEDLKLVLEFGRTIPPELWIFVLAFSFLLFAIKWDKKRHLLCRWEATQQLKHLKRLNTPEEQITHLRGVNPYVFEEMILTALKHRGYQIKRNKRYSGDGGIDGQTIIEGHCYLIQAKRYANHINPAHVQSFARLCERRGRRGLFVHTGRTGKKSNRIAQFSEIEMISGDRLLNMLNNGHRMPQDAAKHSFGIPVPKNK